jgi:hypothetical protein
MTMATKKTDTVALPKDVREADLKYPSWKSKVRVEQTLTLYYVTMTRDGGKDWFIANLQIRRSRNGHANRTYATRVSDGKTGWRIGAGPHVTKTITVYVTTKNKARLAKLVDMASKGEEDANIIRDRISSRRAQSALRRGAWSW